MTIQISLLFLFFILSVICAVICILQPRVWYRVAGILTILIAIIYILVNKSL